MIVFKENETGVEDPLSTKIDGIYLAIVIRSYVDSENNECLCYVYIPEIHGFINCAWMNACDFPRVSVPVKQDNDDPGHIPVTGELLKVSFDDGNSNSCRFINSVKTTQQTITANRDYLQYGTIPTAIITDITDPAIINKIKEWKEWAYYITIGKRVPSANDFVCRTLISNQGSGYHNLFIAPLTLPLASYSYSFSASGELFQLPIFSTNIYNASDIMLNLYRQNTQEMAKLFTNPIPENSILWQAPENFYRYNTKAFGDNYVSAARLVACEGSGVPWSMNQILYPGMDSTNLPLDIFKGNQNLTDCISWWQMYEPVTNDPNYKINNLGKFIIEHINIYENEWASSVASWQTGIASLLPENYKTENKYKILISLCLTICPWSALALLRYRNSSAFELMTRTLQYYGSNYQNYNNEYKIQADTSYSYTTTVFNDNTFSDFGTTIQTAIRTTLCADNNFKGFVSIFRDKVYELFNNTKTINIGRVNIGQADSWKLCDMDAKFNRLKQISNVIESAV